MLKVFLYVITVSLCLQATHAQEEFYENSFDTQQEYYEDPLAEDKEKSFTDSVLPLERPQSDKTKTVKNKQTRPNKKFLEVKTSTKPPLKKFGEIPLHAQSLLNYRKGFDSLRKHVQEGKRYTRPSTHLVTSDTDPKFESDLEKNQIFDIEMIPNSTADTFISSTAVTLPLTVNIEERREIYADDRINCKNFAAYALNCTLNAAKIYNSTSTAPPQPEFFYDWCKAIRLMTDCAVAWNTECRSRTQSHFSEDSLKGHQHVLTHICEDDEYVTKYEDVKFCLEDTRPYWEQCYTKFKSELDKERKNKLPATHYEMHFKLCCLRASFRACTSKLYLKKSMMCNAEEGITMQKFSVVISEGDIYQDCEQNIIYENCPDGDPRPLKEIALESKMGDRKSKIRSSNSGPSVKVENCGVYLKVPWHIHGLVLLVLLL